MYIQSGQHLHTRCVPALLPLRRIMRCLDSRLIPKFHSVRDVAHFLRLRQFFRLLGVLLRVLPPPFRPVGIRHQCAVRDETRREQAPSWMMPNAGAAALAVAAGLCGCCSRSSYRFSCSFLTGGGAGGGSGSRGGGSTPSAKIFRTNFLS